MTTLAHRLSRLMPRPLAEGLRPVWHRSRNSALFRLRGGRVSWDSDLKCKIASREFAGRRLEVAVRSYRELRRFLNFNGEEGDVVADWMGWISDCEVLYDIGSANGLEGFYVNHLHGSKIIFVEPYAPSIETLLKTIARRVKTGGSSESFEVVHAGCDSEIGYHRYLFHGLPVPGETGNSFSDVDAYCRGGKGHLPIVLSQWVAGVSLDSLHWRYKLPLATHVKMDIDGFELKALEGADRLLKSGNVRSWAIEVNGVDQLGVIGKLMKKNGYVDVASWEHYPGYEHYTGDHIYVRKDLTQSWHDAFPNSRSEA